MNLKTALLAGSSFLMLGSIPILAQETAQQANPTPGCTSTPAQLAAIKKVALDFNAADVEGKIALMDRSLIQHNPVQHKRAQIEHISDYESFAKTFRERAARRIAPSTGPQAPAGNRAEIVVAECDIVTMIHKVYRQDPTAPPGTFYEAFTFDAYRIKDGKIVEHWDAATIAPPARGGRRQ
jgi:predicted SnoaL-like aldol condensation-catalyzing enzyme